MAMLLLTLLVSLAACDTTPRTPPTVTVAPAAAPAAVAPVAPPPTPARSTSTAHIAVFRGDDLTQCLDVEGSAEPSRADRLSAAIERLTAGLQGDVQPPESVVRLQRPCSASFADRTALGTCTRTIGAAAEPVSMVLREAFYTVAVLRSDAQMRDCLSDGGDWVAVRRDSPEARRIEAEADLRDATEDLRRLQGRR